MTTGGVRVDKRTTASRTCSSLSALSAEKIMSNAESSWMGTIQDFRRPNARLYTLSTIGLHSSLKEYG